jgi:hypothetical protein
MNTQNNAISFDLNIAGTSINITITVKEVAAVPAPVIVPQIEQRIDLSHSSFIETAMYNAQTRFLVLEFKHGGLYRYLDVPQWVFDELAKASSPGEFFNEKVKPFYTYKKL